MALHKTLTLEARLDALRQSDPRREWHSLDDRRRCTLCDRTFTGRQVDVAISAAGRVKLRCPSEDCPGAPPEWIHPGNPLISEKAWREWSRVLESKKTNRAQRAPFSSGSSSAPL